MNASAFDAQACEAVRAAAVPLCGGERDHDALVALAGAARFVLIGEASHGSHEFYRERALLTQRLIAQHGFHAVAIEGDWPDAYRVNRYVRALNDDASAEDALAGFRRFPTWMWRNAVVTEFVDWLHDFNQTRTAEERAGLYGLDLYSLHSSMSAVLQYLAAADPAAAQRARERYACFDQFGHDSQVYGLMAGLGTSKSCEREVIAMLVDLRRRASQALPGGRGNGEQAFDAEQNARLVMNAEAYYRSMYLSDVSSWNLRDRHMMETLNELEHHLTRGGIERPKIVVWAHNSHLGDARATEMGQRGELNLGQLVRERHGTEAFLIGFSTHTGSVTAASDWDGAAERMLVLPSRHDSYEGLMHEVGLERFMLPLRGASRQAQLLGVPRLQRAIGVLYRPDTERQSHYLLARLPQQFDALIHIDMTRAVEPLERNAEWSIEAPETYPAGL
ncbi:erythromycin esterase family protein [Ideonella sp.]|uniref:erythromycin esterase family protein n=1 Tax=Ideonella sp. TaxID=1929293 RepID=UPI002B45A9B4|nr:erythromycin esterase family protein [Ideonella sp.]HJV69042.1 erythromycin esterase family protein [Ideonella sp.]